MGQRVILRKGVFSVFVKVCEGVGAVKGLVLRRRLLPSEGLLLRCPSGSCCVHMFLVFFSVDVVWLDEGFRVVDVRRNVRPFSGVVCPRGGGVVYVLEVLAGRSSVLRVGDVLGREEVRW